MIAGYPKLVTLEIVRDRRVIGTSSRSLALPGHIHVARLAVHTDSVGSVIPICRSVVASCPELVALGIVGHRRVIEAGSRALALPRYVHIAGAVERHGDGGIAAPSDRSVVASYPKFGS